MLLSFLRRKGDLMQQPLIALILMLDIPGFLKDTSMLSFDQRPRSLCFIGVLPQAGGVLWPSRWVPGTDQSEGSGDQL